VFLFYNFFFLRREIWLFFQEGKNRRTPSSAGRDKGGAARTTSQTIYPTQYQVMTT
jgi:hypothetical protein